MHASEFWLNVLLTTFRLNPLFPYCCSGHASIPKTKFYLLFQFLTYHLFFIRSPTPFSITMKQNGKQKSTHSNINFFLFIKYTHHSSKELCSSLGYFFCYLSYVTCGMKNKTIKLDVDDDEPSTSEEIKCKVANTIGFMHKDECAL